MGCRGPAAPMPVLRSAPPVLFLAPGTDFSWGSRGQGGPQLLGKGWVEEKRGEGEKPTAASMGGGGGRQTKPSSQRKMYGRVF